MEKRFLNPAEITEAAVQMGSKKCGYTFGQTVWLGILAGIYISLGGFAALVISHGINTPGLSNFAGAAVFPVGLMLVVVCGGELFTGNCLILPAVLEEKLGITRMVNNLIIVYLANFAGSIIIVLLILGTGLLNMSEGLLGAISVKIAANKVNLTFLEAFTRGILCNVLVCLGVWMAIAARDTVSKLWACWFPVMMFVLSSFEHSIANMFFIPLGILAKNSESLAAAGKLTAVKVSGLNWTGFVVNNLIPVTMGNLIGGTLLVGGIYWYVYRKGHQELASQSKSNAGYLNLRGEQT